MLWFPYKYRQNNYPLTNFTFYSILYLFTLEVIKEYNREESILCTKATHILRSNGNVDISNSPNFLKESVKEALTRLQTDYIDLCYIHMPDEDTPKYEAVGAFKELKDEGIIRAIGVSNFDINQLQEANQDNYVDVMQSEYNSLNRKAEQDILPYAEQHNISFITYFPSGAGLLAGKYNKTANSMTSEKTCQISNLHYLKRILIKLKK